MDFAKLASINLIAGKGGGDPKNGLCLMEMVSYFAGADRVTDTPPCACPMLTKIAIILNDRAPSQQARDTLKPLLPLLSGSRDERALKARAWFVMRECAVRILAARLDLIADKAPRPRIPPSLAAALRAAADPAAMRKAVNAADRWLCAYASADAYAAAYGNVSAYAYGIAVAYTHAKTNTNANDNANDADAAAYANAAAYGIVATNVEAYAQRRLQAFEATREILTDALKLGAHGGLDLTAPATDARADRLLELVC